MITRLARRCRDAERVRRHGLMLVAAAIASFVVSLLVAAQGALDAVTMLGMLFGAPMVAVGSLRAWSAQRELGRAREPFELPSARVI